MLLSHRAVYWGILAFDSRSFSQTASTTLANATLPFLLQLADKGFKKAIEENVHLRAGMTCWGGKLTLRETALKQNREWTDAEELVKSW